MKFKTTLLLGIVAISLTAEDQAPPTVEAHLRLIAMQQPIMGYGYKIGKKMEPLVIAPDFFTQEITYRGPAHFELLPYQAERGSETEASKPGETGASKPTEPVKPPSPEAATKTKPLAWLDLPVSPTPQHLILLVDPSRGSEGGIFALPDAPGSFPYGSLRFMNLCPFPLEIRLHGQKTPIPARGSAVVLSKASEGHYYEGAIYSLIDGQSTIAYNLRIFQQNDVRTLYFVTPTAPSSPQVALKAVEDRKAGDAPLFKGR